MIIQALLSSVPLLLAIGLFVFCPVALYVPVARSLAIEDTNSMFATENEFVIVAFNVRSDAVATSAANTVVSVVAKSYPTDMSSSASTLCEEGPLARSTV